MLEVKYQDVNELVPYSNNARKHPKKQLQKLADCIRNFSFLVPVLVDQNKMILAGHGRVEAAKLAGLKEVPTISADHLSEAQKRAFIIADNRLSQDASWDKEKLKAELEFLSDFDFEINLTGFDTTEIDLILDDQAAVDPADNIEQLPSDYKPVTKLGDLWELGPHRLICGNSLLPETYQALLGNERAQLVFTDPPYNVAINGHVKRNAAGAREFAMATGEMSQDEFTRFLETFLRQTVSHLVEGAILYVCMDWRHMQELLATAEPHLEFKQLCVWAKDQGGMGTFYRSQHELVFVFKHGTAPHINNFELGQKGRYRTNVWAYPMVHTVPDAENLAHPTVKPTALVADALRDCSHRQDIVLDPFGGSGTTLIAAEKTGRQARLIELDPIYCDLTIRRWQKLTKKKALLSQTGESFDILKSAFNEKE